MSLQSMKQLLVTEKYFIFGNRIAFKFWNWTNQKILPYKAANNDFQN